MAPSLGQTRNLLLVWQMCKPLALGAILFCVPERKIYQPKYPSMRLSNPLITVPLLKMPYRSASTDSLNSSHSRDICMSDLFSVKSLNITRNLAEAHLIY